MFRSFYYFFTLLGIFFSTLVRPNCCEQPKIFRFPTLNFFFLTNEKEDKNKNLDSCHRGEKYHQFGLFNKVSKIIFLFITYSNFPNGFVLDAVHFKRFLPAAPFRRRRCRLPLRRRRWYHSRRPSCLSTSLVRRSASASRRRLEQRRSPMKTSSPSTPNLNSCWTIRRNVDRHLEEKIAFLIFELLKK